MSRNNTVLFFKLSLDTFNSKFLANKSNRVNSISVTLFSIFRRNDISRCKSSKHVCVEELEVLGRLTAEDVAVVEVVEFKDNGDTTISE